MPKGRSGLIGGAYWPTPSPRLREISDELLDELEKKRPSKLGPLDREATWKKIDTAVASYLGQSKKGEPPTEKERDEQIRKISKAASQLRKAILEADVGVQGIVHSAMRRRGGDLSELKKHLDRATSIHLFTRGVRVPKASADPHRDQLTLNLIHIWREAVGKGPGKTGYNEHKVERTSPFFNWANRIAEIIMGKNFPCEQTDSLIELSKPDGYAAPSFEALNNDKPIEVELIFKPEAAEEVKDYQFHPSQTIEPLANGEIRIRFVAESELAIARECMYWRDQLASVNPAGATPWKWSDLMDGFWPEQGEPEDGEEPQVPSLR